MAAKSPAEAKYLDRVAALGCILCRHLYGSYPPAQVHHIKSDQGLGQRARHWLTVPLCPEHHSGPSGLHGLGTRGFYTRYKLGELDLLGMTIEALNARP